MQTTVLATVKHRIRPGQPLPFNVRNADQTLLLARGHMLEDREQVDTLISRGAIVDLAELVTAADRARQAPRELLPRLWQEGLSRVGQALMHAPHHSFRSALEDATDPMLILVERDPDLAIFQVLRQDSNAATAYGVQRSMNTAVTAFLVAQRLGWTPGEVEKVFKIALTSNLSMLELQGELATQRHPLSPEQREALQSHPHRSARQLEAAGVVDTDWLNAVSRHHEMEDGSGYPTGSSDVGDLASLVRRADVYTSKLCARAHRDALSADVAGRQMFMQDPGHPMTAALVKEFGVYPPGCHVRLASGELGIVVQRGPTVTTPVVACLTTAQGKPMATPVRVDTSQPGRNVVAVVGQRTVNIEATADKLMSLTLR
jgi:HD-GYP domain-containing protein (c-di-GMP phosphodiesterase class II)